jgi:hypothetical protein
MSADLGLWQWLAATAVALLSWLLGRVWTVRGVLKDLQHNDTDFANRIKSLEDHDRQQADRYDRQKAEMLEEVKKEICNIVKLAIKDLIIDHNQKLATISTDVAIQSKLMEQMMADVTAIFGRLNRRSEDRDEQQGDRRK